MLVFWKERLTFLAVPKTGSTAYAEALGPFADIVLRDPPELKHAPLYRYDRFFRPMFDQQGATSMETLAVVREPVDWLSSWYRYRGRPFMRGKPTSTADISFDAFVEAYCAVEPVACARVGSQAKFLTSRRKGQPVTHLFRYDDQDALKSFLEARLGRSFTMPRVNVSPGRDVQLSPDMAGRLRAHAAEDFALYGSIPDGGRHENLEERV